MTFLKSAPMSTPIVQPNLANPTITESPAVAASDLIYSHYWELRGWVCQKAAPKASRAALTVDPN